MTKPSSRFLNSFSTPIYMTYLDESFINNIEETIVPKLSKLEHSVSVDTDFFSSKIITKKELPDLFNFIDIELDNYSQATNIQRGPNFQYWVQDYKPNHFQGFHTHPGSTISGVYFVRANNAGPIQFKSPNPFIEFTQFKDPSSLDKFGYFEVIPTKGMLLLFPSWLSHQVIPSSNPECIRTSIAFNTLPKPINYD